MRFSSLEIRRQELEKVSRMICRRRKQRGFHGKAECVEAVKKMSSREERAGA